MEKLRIDIELIDMKYQEITECRESFIEIEPDRLRWKECFSAKEPKDKDDLMLGYTDEEYEWDLYVKKSSIVSVDFSLQTPEDFDPFWGIELAVLGRTSDIKLYFKDKSKAKEIFGILLKWAFE